MSECPSQFLLCLFLLHSDLFALHHLPHLPMFKDPHQFLFHWFLLCCDLSSHSVSGFPQFLFCWFLFCWFLLGWDLFVLRLGCLCHPMSNFYSTDFISWFLFHWFYCTDIYCAVTFLKLDLGGVPITQCQRISTNFYSADFYSNWFLLHCDLFAFWLGTPSFNVWGYPPTFIPLNFIALWPFCT